jgi:hypothetical protein
MKYGVVKVLFARSKSLSLLVFLVFFIFFFISVLSIAYAQTYITKYLGTTDVTSIVGGTVYWELADTYGTANTATSIKNAKSTGKFYFKPGTAKSTANSEPIHLFFTPPFVLNDTGTIIFDKASIKMAK